jgi:hypothetical protein
MSANIFEPSAWDRYSYLGTWFVLFFGLFEFFAFLADGYYVATGVIGAALILTIMYNFVRTDRFIVQDIELKFRKYWHPGTDITIPISNIAQIKQYWTYTLFTARGALWYQALAFEYKPAKGEKVPAWLKRVAERINEPNALEDGWGGSWRLLSKDHVVREKGIGDWGTTEIVLFLHHLHSKNPHIVLPEKYRARVHAVGNKAEYEKAMAAFEDRRQRINLGTAGLGLIVILFFICMFAYDPNNGGWDFFRFFKVMIRPWLDFK